MYWRDLLVAVDGGGVEGLAGADLVVSGVGQEAPRHVEDGLQAREGILHSHAPNQSPRRAGPL